MGIDPSTARRQFKRYYGMTFQAYHRARRMGLALREVRRGEWNVDVPRLPDGLAAINGFEDRELPRAFLEQPCDPEEIFRALARTERRPPVRKSLARRADRSIDIGLARLRDLGERFFARRIDRGVALA